MLSLEIHRLRNRLILTITAPRVMHLVHPHLATSVQQVESASRVRAPRKLRACGFWGIPPPPLFPGRFGRNVDRFHRSHEPSSRTRRPLLLPFSLCCFGGDIDRFHRSRTRKFPSRTRGPLHLPFFLCGFGGNVDWFPMFHIFPEFPRRARRPLHLPLSLCCFGRNIDRLHRSRTLGVFVRGRIGVRIGLTPVPGSGMPNTRRVILTG